MFEQLDIFVFTQEIFENALTKTINELYNDGNISVEEFDDEED
jgi:hypothetical protein